MIPFLHHFSKTEYFISLNAALTTVLSNNNCFSLRISWWFTARPGVDAGHGPRRTGSVGVLDHRGGARGRLGARPKLLVAERLAHGRLADGRTESGGLPGRTGEPFARLGQELLLLSAVITHPDHLVHKKRGHG